MKAVAMMTPDPKYLAKKKALRRILLLSAAPFEIMGNKVPVRFVSKSIRLEF